jgi:hypothetical protein
MNRNIINAQQAYPIDRYDDLLAEVLLAYIITIII